MSLSSLAQSGGARVGRVYIVEDAKGRFNDEQRVRLTTIIKNLEFHCLGNIDWASLETLKTELSAFAIAANGVHSNDFIAKCDSDILFFSETKLNEVSVCSSSFVGDGHYSDYKYAQGGLYFLRAPLAARLASGVDDGNLSRAIDIAGTIAEDQVISVMVKNYTQSIWLTRIMLFPNEFERVNLGNKLVRNEFSAIHFVHKKSEMPYFFNKIDRSKS